MVKRPVAVIVTALALAGVLAGCGAKTPAPTTTYTQPQLAYRVLADFPDVFWCDPYVYPIGRPDAEKQAALDQFPAIQAATDEFSAILEHLGLAAQSSYTEEQQLAVFREHEILTLQVAMASSGTGYTFTLRTGEGDGERVTGKVTASGVITVTKREQSFNTCPICLTEGTLIDTPSGQIPVEDMEKGMAVWTYTETGRRIEATVMATGKTPVPAGFKVVELVLEDGRTLRASPGHPTADGRAIGDYAAGDRLDGSVVASTRQADYRGSTYDLLPSGTTGLYRANGILLKSTLAGQ
jgi:hypothetical protein